MRLPFAVAAGLLLSGVACAAKGRAPLESKLPRRAPSEIVIRTDRFTFHMGAAVDETWPARAEQTRDALGAELDTLIEQEDTTVALVARQLGVMWPAEPVDFDVSLEEIAPGAPVDARCETKLPRLLHVRDRRVVKAEPDVFFACVLGRTFTRLTKESALYRAMVDGRGGDEAGRREADRLYGCIATYAVASVIVARAADDREARVVESRLADACSAGELDWLSREWIKRVREEVSPMEFGARAAKEVLRAKGL